MKPVKDAPEPSLRQDMAGLLSIYTHDAANPLINLESLVHYLQRQSNDLSAAISSGHNTNVEHLIGKAIPQTVEMMLSSSRKLHHMNTALNQLYHCYCDDLEDEMLDLNSLVALEISKLKVPCHINIYVADLPSIYADPDAMQAVFRAFISNAVNSCIIDKPTRIDLSCDQHSDGRKFHIQDQGCGIIAEETNKVFSPFYRGIKSTGYGLGIGLNIAQALLNRYGSHINITSTINQGSHVMFTWPDR